MNKNVPHDPYAFDVVVTQPQRAATASEEKPAQVCIGNCRICPKCDGR